jgi:hypothetical protein
VLEGETEDIELAQIGTGIGIVWEYDGKTAPEDIERAEVSANSAG